MSSNFSELLVYIQKTAPWAKYSIFIFLPSGISKLLISKQMGEMWPMLPKWFWPIAGIYELVTLGVFYFLKDKSAEAIISFYMFLGGVLSSSTTLSFKPENFIPFCIGIIGTGLNGLERGIEPSVTHLFAVFGGFVIGNLIAKAFGPKRKAL